MNRREKISFLKGLMHKDPEALKELQEMRKKQTLPAKTEDEFRAAFDQAVSNGPKESHPVMVGDYGLIVDTIEAALEEKVRVDEIPVDTMDKICQVFDILWPEAKYMIY
jgi:hypothetical protein